MKSRLLTSTFNFSKLKIINFGGQYADPLSMSQSIPLRSIAVYTDCKIPLHSQSLFACDKSPGKIRGWIGSRFSGQVDSINVIGSKRAEEWHSMQKLHENTQTYFSLNFHDFESKEMRAHKTLTHASPRSRCCLWWSWALYRRLWPDSTQKRSQVPSNTDPQVIATFFRFAIFNQLSVKCIEIYCTRNSIQNCFWPHCQAECRVEWNCTLLLRQHLEK